MADKKIEEEAQAIIDGRRRTRRKNRDLMGEGSDDESDDEENEERRRRMARRMKKRDDVEKLGLWFYWVHSFSTLVLITFRTENNPLTKAFADTYQSTVLDDDQEFAHLAADDTQGVLDQLSSRRDEENEYDEDEEEEIPEYEEETQPRAMDPFEIRQKVRELRQKRGSSPVRPSAASLCLTGLLMPCLHTGIRRRGWNGLGRYYMGGLHGRRGGEPGRGKDDKDRGQEAVPICPKQTRPICFG